MCLKSANFILLDGVIRVWGAKVIQIVLLLNNAVQGSDYRDDLFNRKTVLQTSLI